MHIVMLRPATKRLKQLIKEHGRYWVLLRIQEKVACFDNKQGAYVRPFGDADGNHSRWVLPEHIVEKD